MVVESASRVTCCATVAHPKLLNLRRKSYLKTSLCIMHTTTYPSFKEEEGNSIFINSSLKNSDWAFCLKGGKKSIL